MLPGGGEIEYVHPAGGVCLTGRLTSYPLKKKRRESDEVLFYLSDYPVHLLCVL